MLRLNKDNDDDDDETREYKLCVLQSVLAPVLKVKCSNFWWYL